MTGIETAYEDVLRVVLATENDISTLVDMRTEARARQMAHGHEQWRSYEGDPQWFENQIKADEVWVVRRISDDYIIGSIRLLWEDSFTWDDKGADGRAGYIHGLMTRHPSGVDFPVGTFMLEWAENHFRQHGRDFSRLDCIWSNPFLQSYYTSHGYREMGIKEFTPDQKAFWVRLFEKDLSN